jgi:hypothetical protein
LFLVKTQRVRLDYTPESTWECSTVRGSENFPSIVPTRICFYNHRFVAYVSLFVIFAQGLKAFSEKRTNSISLNAQGRISYSQPPSDETTHMPFASFMYEDLIFTLISCPTSPPRMPSISPVRKQHSSKAPIHTPRRLFFYFGPCFLLQFGPHFSPLRPF